MRRDDLAADLLDRQSADGYVFPAYEDYCFASVPGTVYDLFGADIGPTLPSDAVDAALGRGGLDHVVVLLVDGFGYEQWSCHVDDETMGLLPAVEETGTVTPLTSVFPSETASAIPTYHTANYPHEHGVHGWFQHVPELDHVVEALPFTTMNGPPVPEVYPDFERGDLYVVPDHYDATESETGVDTHLLVPTAIASENRRAVGYDGLGEFADRLGETVEGGGPRSVTFAYLPHVDAASHRSGTRSEEYHETLVGVDDAVSRGLSKVSDETAEDTAVVVTADHGHVDTDPNTNVDLRDPWFAPLWGLFERRDDGTAVPPTGSPRQLHLHLRDKYGDWTTEGVEAAARRIVDRAFDALVLTRDEAIDRELWGPGDYSETFRERCGDLVVVPKSKGVWYEADHIGLVGMHGGMTEEEMLVPFGTARLADLR
ncbi:alkaline phosphatase family protein [Halobium salinum]|uniref:Alkaline phosphatase family protein n=1 Tax=Halobium salinum TaxID=1364940 RepID=A0ABD5P6E7_9EURY|nr:alkaline phosphatase family protein [Halobium salinum]